MKKYVFYQWFDETTPEYDLNGEDYEALIDLCGKYSTTFALDVPPKRDVQVIDILEKFRIPKPDNITYKFDSMTCIDLKANTAVDFEIRFYKVTSELCSILKEVVFSVYEWIYGFEGLKNPGDPMFFRADGSPFFTSCIHEGDLFLHLRDNENADDVLKHCNWRVYD